MQNNKKKKLIVDAMQRLMLESSTQSISVSDIAKEAGIGKGSIYYYFKSKEDILEAVIERSYSDAVEKAKRLLNNAGMDSLTKMEIIFKTCRDSSQELLRQEANNFFELQQIALLHQQFIQVMIKNLRPVLADIICQGNKEGLMRCGHPQEAAEIVLIVLTNKLDTQLMENDPKQLLKTLEVFAFMLETSFQIERGRLDFLCMP